MFSDAKSLPFMKVAIRDLKAYLQVSGYRAIPIGVNSINRGNEPLSEFLSCGGQSVSADFFFYFLGSCTDTSRIREDIEHMMTFQFPTPIFVVNYPCDTTKHADSEILMSAYNNNYTTWHSGPVFFNYFDSRRSNSTTRNGKIRSLIQLTQTDKLFSGLVEAKGDSVSLRPEFSAVSSQMVQIQPSSTAMADYTPTRIAQSS
jgi:hypothetical protein